MTWLYVCIICITHNACIILKTTGCFTNFVLSYSSTFSRTIYKRASLHVMSCPFSLFSMCISPAQVLATYICFLVVRSGAWLSRKWYELCECKQIDHWQARRFHWRAEGNHLGKESWRLVNCALQPLCCSVVKGG